MVRRGWPHDSLRGGRGGKKSQEGGIENGHQSLIRWVTCEFYIRHIRNKPGWPNSCVRNGSAYNDAVFGGFAHIQTGIQTGSRKDTLSYKGLKKKWQNCLIGDQFNSWKRIKNEIWSFFAFVINYWLPVCPGMGNGKLSFPREQISNGREKARAKGKRREIVTRVLFKGTVSQLLHTLWSHLKGKPTKRRREKWSAIMLVIVIIVAFSHIAAGEKKLVRRVKQKESGSCRG